MKSRRLRPIRLWLEELEGRLAPAALHAASLNWSGYAIDSGRASISYISASWTVASVIGARDGYSATWVGIDGANSRTVEQIGTESDFTDGAAGYYAWYEMYPAPSVVINKPVAPGDQITASVAYAAGNGFTLTISNSSWDAPFTKTVAAQAARSSAEAIVEAPSDGGVLPLANFGTQTIANATVTVNNTKTSLAAAPGVKLEQIDLVSRGNKASATTSTLDASGSGFAVTFQAASHTATPVANGRSSNRTHDTDQVVIFVTITAPSVTPGLAFIVAPNPGPPAPISTPLPPSTVLTPLTTATPVLIDPFVGSGITDVLPAAHDNAQDRGQVVPGGPIQVPPAAPTPPMVIPGANPQPQPQSRLDDSALPGDRLSFFAADDEPVILQDESATAHELADTAERTVEVAGIVLVLGLGTSCGISLGDQEARKKPIAL